MSECKSKKNETDAAHSLEWTGTAQRVGIGQNKYEHKCKLCGEIIWLEYVFSNQ